MIDPTRYDPLLHALVERFAGRVKLIALFGSRSRGEARPASDHDLFVVIDDLPADPLERRRVVLDPLLPELTRLPERLSLVAKTPAELLGDLTPLILDVFVDGICLYGEAYFQELRGRVLDALRASGLQRRRIAGAWMWIFPALPRQDWELTWEGYREGV